MQVSRVNYLQIASKNSEGSALGGGILRFASDTYACEMQPRPSEAWCGHFKRIATMEVPSWQAKVFTFRRSESACRFTCRPDERDEWLGYLDHLIHLVNAYMSPVEK